MPTFTKGFQLPHGHSTPKSSSVLHRNLHLNFVPPWMMTNKSGSMSVYPPWMLQLPALLPSSQGLAGLGMQAVVSAGIWCWFSRWEVTVLQQLQRENCMEAVAPKRCLTLQMPPVLFSRADTFLGLQYQHQWFIQKQRNTASDSFFILFIDSQEGRKEVKGRNICKTLWSCYNRWHTFFG